MHHHEMRPATVSGGSESITVRFAPTQTQRTLGLAATLTIFSDDPDQPAAEVPIIGDAVPVTVSSFAVE